MRVAAAGVPTGILIAAATLFGCDAHAAQIYTCVGKDGSRVFSDQRCGPDAKLVTTTPKKKAPAAKSGDAAKAAKVPAKVTRSAAELEALTSQCDAGDMNACREWTLGGGPSVLRERERKSEQDCEAGSLAACEDRYCREGLDADCRARVQRTARLAGDTWYLRDEIRGLGEGQTKYLIRCIPEGVREIRDITVTCSGQAGPKRCYTANPEQGLPRLAQAAASDCSRVKPANADVR